MENKPTDFEKIKISALWDSLKRFDGYIATVNFKSGLLATLNSAIFAGVILKSSEIVSLTSGYIKLGVALSLLLIGLTALLSIFLVIKTIWPNLLSESNKVNASLKSLFFFKSVAENYTKEDYVKKIESSDFDTFLKDLAGQVHEVAAVTNAKMMTITNAGRVAAANLLFLAVLSALLITELLGVKLCQG